MHTLQSLLVPLSSARAMDSIFKKENLYPNEIQLFNLFGDIFIEGMGSQIREKSSGVNQGVRGAGVHSMKK